MEILESNLNPRNLLCRFFLHPVMLFTISISVLNMHCSHRIFYHVIQGGLWKYWNLASTPETFHAGFFPLKKKIQNLCCCKGANDKSSPIRPPRMRKLRVQGEFVLFFLFEQNAGDARTQSPPTKNYAPEFPTFGEIASFNWAKCKATVST